MWHIYSVKYSVFSLKHAFVILQLIELYTFSLGPILADRINILADIIREILGQTDDDISSINSSVRSHVIM